MKTKFPIFVLPMLLLAVMFYAFSVSENSEISNTGSESSVSGLNVLILVHDSTVATTKRTADRDTLRKYLPAVVGANTLMTFDTTTSLPDLSPYDFIILQETSFDASNVRYLGATARSQIKAWLATGTALDKKKLLSMGGDQGWNYSRPGSAAQDLEFADTYSKFTYRVDNGPGSSSPSVTGVNIDIGNTRNLTSTVPGGGYWPDGSSMSAGGTALYKYQNHTDADTLAAIGNAETGFRVATMFQDPRYFDGDFGTVFEAMALWLNENTPLPVELSSFISTVNGSNVTLNWTTAKELNNSGFDIERSSAANEWTKVGSVEGNGTTNESSTYSFTDKSLSTGMYSYRLKQIDFNGNFEYFNLSSEVNVGVPASFKLSQNYPNPFNPSTTIEFALPVDGHASITVFDMSGRQVSSLVNEFKTSGYHTIKFDGSSLSSGNYFYKLQVTGSSNFTETRKMVLIK